MDYSMVDSRILQTDSLRMNYILCKDKINTVQYKFSTLAHSLYELVSSPFFKLQWLPQKDLQSIPRSDN